MSSSSLAHHPRAGAPGQEPNGLGAHQPSAHAATYAETRTAVLHDTPRSIAAAHARIAQTFVLSCLARTGRPPLVIG